MIKIRKIAKISSLLMAFMLLLSSTGFSIDLHYCQGDIKSFSLFGTAKSCHAKKQSKCRSSCLNIPKAEKNHCSKKKMTCHLAMTETEQADDSHRKCCSNKSIEVSPDLDTQKVIAEQLTETQISFLSAFVAIFYANQSLDLAKLIIPYLNYIPPLLDEDMPVLFQSFLL